MDYNLIYFYGFVGSLFYSLGHYKYNSSNVYIRRQAYRRQSTLYSYYYSPLEGANIYLDCLYVLGVLFLDSLGLDKLHWCGEGYLKGYNRGGKEGEYGSALLVCIKGSFL